MVYPLVANADGVKVKPEHMEQEKLYHCIFKEKIMLAYKDNQEVLHCYEVEEKELVEQVKQCDDKDKVEQIFEDYIAKQNLNN